MTSLKSLLLTSFMILALAGCQSVATEDVEGDPGFEFGKVFNGTVSIKTPLEDRDSDKNFALNISLPEDGSSAELITHGAKSTLDNGIPILFKRSGTRLLVVAAGHNTRVNMSGGLRPFENLIVDVDVHNTEDPAHIVVSVKNVEVFNSADYEDGGADQGTGRYWGVELTEATLHHATVGAPQAVDQN